MLVLDASAAIEWLLETPVGLRVEGRIFADEESLHAPHLLDLEVAQTLRRLAAEGQLTEARANDALQDMVELPLVRYQHDSLLERIWSLRKNLTAYDAAYVALAEALEAPLITCDQRIAKAPGHRAKVEVV